MNYYTISLFVHIVSAMGFFVALGLEWTSLRQIRAAMTSEQLREWMRISNSARRLGIISMLAILASGIYMMATAWGGVAWIIVALGALVLVIILSVAITRRRIAPIGRILAEEKGPLSPTLRSLANHPLLWISMQTRLAIALGIVFLMTAKPDLGGSLLVMGITIVIGLIIYLPMPRRAQAQEGPAPDLK
jgi:hypothetical protein